MVTILIIVAAIAVIAIWIVLAVWVYRDANERGMDAAIWLLIVILTGIIGLIIYLIVRE
nr:PLDc N-terminal domain-containing protein [Candidatus Freyarchaeota archaeon]